PDIKAVYHWSTLNSFIPLAFSDLDTNRVIFGGTRMNSEGGLARGGYVQSLGLMSIWTGPAGTTDWNRILTQNDVADGAGGAAFNLFIDFVLFADNRIATRVQLSDGKTGIWMGDETGMDKVAMIGDTVPGVDTIMTFTMVNHMMANRAGLVAFTDLVDDGLFGLDGIWIGNANGLEIVSIRNQTVDLDTTDTRTIENHSAGHSYRTRTGADGYSGLVNDSGKIAYGVTFYEGGNALLLGSPGGIVVNSAGDAPDSDSTDGICATGALMPDGKPECTLRAAILEANTRHGHNTINFDIDEDPWIFPSTPLPDIKDSVVIDGFSQPGDDNVVLLGDLTRAETHGMVLDGESITIQGLDIGGFGGNGIFIRGSAMYTVGSNNVFGCQIGWMSSMGASMGNGGQGILIETSSYNDIGGAESWQRNYITHNAQCGIWVRSASAYNAIINNVIGVTADDVEDGNGLYGILISDLSDSNLVGGGPDSGNIIAGNIDDGVGLIGSGDCVIEGNVISDNLNGVSLSQDSYYNSLFDNIIGIDELGQADGNRSFGIMIDLFSDSNFVGGSLDSGNVISANDSGGVVVYDSDHTLIAGNYIGIDTGGTVAVGNHGDGIAIVDCQGTIIGEKYIDISTTIGVGNVVSGNDSAGVAVYGGSEGTIITSNLVGFDKDGVNPIANYWGVGVFNSPRTYIGHSGLFNMGFGNTIGANQKTGVLLLSDSCSVVSNSISSNGQGLIPLGGDGIYIDGMANIIGADMLENNFDLNFGAAVMVVDNMTHDNIFNRIQYNNMQGNTKGGIDLAPLGVNPIDHLDADMGPNIGQNAPHFVSATYTLNDYLFVKGTLHSMPNQMYHVIVYHAFDCMEVYGLPNEGYDWILEDYISTDANGDALIDISQGPWMLPVPNLLVMHVTDTAGNTSEFSNCAHVWDQPDGVDLVVEKTDDKDNTILLDTLRYEITVANMGSLAANSVILTDSLPSFISYVADSTDQGSCNYLDGLLTCNLGTMAPFAEARIMLVATVDSIGMIENMAAVSSIEDDVNPASNTAIDSTISSEGYDCGDANGDGAVNIGDPVFIINYIFKSGPTPDPLCVSDANGDDAVNIGDPVYLINYIFKSGPPPVEPCCP
ncbi:MAG: DUF11 domain-containing protein, partial [FCB group bacterium]|nr:DUF11 domain-containing protein [FCB group bacterium]